MAEELIVLESTKRRLSLAISLVDDYAPQGGPLGRMDVSIKIKDRALSAIKNYSGYYLFVDLPPGEYLVQIDADYYLDEELTVTLPLPDPKAPLKGIALKPNPAYPFSAGATLLRGGIRDIASKKPISNVQIKATIKVDYKGGSGNQTLESRTATNGDFVIYIKPAQIAKGNQIQSITVDLGVSHPQYKAQNLSGIKLTEGQKTSVKILELTKAR